MHHNFRSNLYLKDRASSRSRRSRVARDVFSVVSMIVLFGLTPCPMSGQGVGTPAGGGFVPRLELSHHQAGLFDTLTVRELSPFAPLLAVAAPDVNPLPLSIYGLGPAVLGPNLASPFGTLVISNLFADVTGSRVFGFNVPLVLSGMPFHAQFLSVDGAAPFGGVAVSEHRALVFGPDPETHAVATPLGAGTFSLLERFADGTAADVQDPRLSQVAFLSPMLDAVNEMAAARADVPVVDPFFQPAPRVVLPDGSALFGVRTPTFAGGVVRVGADDRIQVVAWAQGTPPFGPFEPLWAVSPFAPYGAVVADAPLPEFGGAVLVVFRTDGRSMPGSPFMAIGIPSPAGVVPSAGSLCFLQGALFFGDAASKLFRLDLTTFAVTPVVFPPSGGLVPTYVDEGCAPAGNGSMLAIGAGQNKNLHDIYVVSANGIAFNLTNLPSDYEDAGSGQADGMQLAADEFGQRVAYMHTVIENEAFVRDTLPPFNERHVTNAGQYINSIDTVVGLGLSASPVVTFAAGNDEAQTDLYAAMVPFGAPAGPVGGIQNVSQTSPTPSAPFGLGATLELQRRFTAGNTTFFGLTVNNVTTRLQVVGDQGGFNLPLGPMSATYPLTGAVLVADQASGGLQRIRTISTAATPTVLATWTSPLATTLIAKAQNSVTHRAAFLFGPSGASTLVIASSTGSLSTFAGPPGIATSALSVDDTGNILAAVTGAGGVIEVWRFDVTTTSWSLLQTTGSSTAPRFLR